jgi:hypothetical protein
MALRAEENSWARVLLRTFEIILISTLKGLHYTEIMIRVSWHPHKYSGFHYILATISVLPLSLSVSLGTV